jgi:hypothetical protein
MRGVDAMKEKPGKRRKENQDRKQENQETSGRIISASSISLA